VRGLLIEGIFYGGRNCKGISVIVEGNRSITRNRRLESHDTFPEFWLGMQKD
jgi:plasmid maintenance system antidote protein VapI